MDIANAKAIVTGGASGLGAGTVTAIIEAGGKAAIFDLPTSNGAKLAASLGDRAWFVPVDVRQPDLVEQAVDHAAEGMEGLNLCVNAAGVGTAHRTLTRDGLMFPLDLFTSTLAINLVGLFDVTRNAARVMAENTPDSEGERGVIINVASIAAFEGQIGQAAYSASKGGIVALTLPLARDLGSIGVRVNTIAPGIMDTPMMARAPAEVRESLAEISVFPKRLGTPADFAKLVIAIAENTMINGEVIRLDGGARMMPK